MTLRTISSAGAIALLLNACGDNPLPSEDSTSTGDSSGSESAESSAGDASSSNSGTQTSASTTASDTGTGTGTGSDGTTTGGDTTTGTTSTDDSGSTGSETETETGSDTGMECDPGEIKCSGECINPLTNKVYCGATMDCLDANAGTMCSADQACADGVCVLECKPTEVLCDGTCINPLTDSKFCGASGMCTGPMKGVECKDSQVCTNGICDEDCGADEIWCSMECVNPKTNSDFCGAEEPCTGDKVGKKCKDDEVCDSGSCQLDCSQDLIACDGTCVNPKTDSKYCGAKEPCETNNGTVCDKGNVCVDGKCELQCPGDLLKCGTDCINPDSDPNYCGASDNCMGANDGDKCITGEACVGGMCVDTSDSGWTVPERVENTSQHDSSPDVAIDGLGNVIAVWEREGNIFANRYESGARSLQSRSWGDEKRIGNLNGGSADPQVGVDLNGNAVVVWTQGNEIFTARYDVNSGEWPSGPGLDWTGGLENASKPSLAMSRGGSALAVWLESEGEDSAIVGRGYDGSNWGTVFVLDHEIGGNDTGAKDFPNVAIDSAGNGIAVWTREDRGGQTHVYSKRFDGRDWGDGVPVQVDSSDDTNARYPQVALTNNGEAYALWLHDASNRYLYHATSTSGGWTNSRRLSGSRSVVVSAPQLAVAEGGHIVAVWLKGHSGGRRSVYAAFRHKDTTNWETGAAIAESSSTFAFDPQVEIDRSGNVFATWSQSLSASEVKSVWVRRRVASTSSWTPSAELDKTNGEAGMLRLAVNPQGQAAVTWQQYVNSNSDDIYVSRYNN